jgi:hypothetical protein
MQNLSCFKSITKDAEKETEQVQEECFKTWDSESWQQSLFKRELEAEFDSEIGHEQFSNEQLFYEHPKSRFPTVYLASTITTNQMNSFIIKAS